MPHPSTYFVMSTSQLTSGISASHPTQSGQTMCNSNFVNYEYWIRIVATIHFAGKEICLLILKKEGLPIDGAQLHQTLLKYQSTIKKSLNTRKISQSQYDLIFPVNGITNINLFDITLFTFIIKVMYPKKYGVFCDELRQWRNGRFHEGKVEMTEQEFNKIWNNLQSFITSNGHGFIVKKIDEFKAAPIDRKSHFIVEAKLGLLEMKLDNEIANKASTVDLQKQKTDLSSEIQSMKLKLENYVEDEFNKRLNITLQRVDKLGKNIALEIKGLEEKNRLLECNQEVLTQRIDKVEESLESARKDTQDTVVDRVWEVMFESKSLGIDNWSILAEKLHVHLGGQQNKKTFIKNSLRNHDISWERLKTALYEIDKTDVVEHLKKNTNLTKGLTAIIKEHKQRTFEGTECKTIHTGFVDLAVVESHIVEERWNNTDEKEFPYMKFNIPRTAYKNITLQELIEDEDLFVVVNGIAGVGKSTLCEEIKHQWSAGRLWNGQNGQLCVPLLLSISCRMMNIKKFETIQRFISYLLPNLENVRLLEDKKAVLVIDGADELQGIEKLSLDTSEPILKLFCDVINFPAQRFFNKIIITSRPKIASKIRQFCKQELKVKTKNVEVIGFNSDSIRLFVQTQFQDNPNTLENIMRRIHENRTMEAMASIPIFLKSYCHLFSEDSYIPTSSTMTELLLYTILNFFKQSYKNNGKQRRNVSIRELTKDKELIDLVTNLAELSYKTLTEKKVTFFQDDTGIDLTKLILLEQVGFITKVSDLMEGDIYQYRHLSFQETFAALFIIYGNEEFQRKCFENENLRDALPFVSGLEGILKRDSTTTTDHLKAFVQKVTNKISTDSDVKNFLTKREIIPLYYICQSEYLELPSQHFIDNKMKSLRIDDKSTLLRECKLRFWNHTLPNIKSIRHFVLSNLQKSDNVELLARLSCKTSYLQLIIGEDENIEHWMEYFKQLSDQSDIETCHFDYVQLHSCQCIRVDHVHFLRHVSDLLIRGFVLPWLDYLIGNFEKNELHIKRLRINSNDNDDDTMEMIGMVCKYISDVTICHYVEDLSALYKHMHTNTRMDSLKLNTNISDVKITRFKNVERLILIEETNIDNLGKIEKGIDHIVKELRSLYESEEERKLRYVEVGCNHVTLPGYFKRFESKFDFPSKVDIHVFTMSITF